MTHIDFKTISISELAALINQKLREHDIHVVLVGGACVTIYSHNQYLSYDLDFATFESKRKIKKALSELGFEPKGKYFIRNDCSYFIDFVSPPVAVGLEIVNKFEILNTALGKIELLTPTDCIKDRLASYFHWEDLQALDQAVKVFNDQKIDLQEIERWAKEENHLEGFRKFLKVLGKSER